MAKDSRGKSTCMEENPDDEQANKNGNQSFQCDECGQNFVNESSFKEHQRNGHKDRTIHKCVSCDREFKTERGLKMHLASHDRNRNHTCEVCHKNFPFLHKLNIHMTSHTGHKPSRCDICGMAFSGYCTLRKHKLYVHGEGVKRYKCDYCLKCYRDAHQKRVHERVHTGEKPFKCDVCDRNFAQMNSLRNHLLTHSDSRPTYKCDICHNAYTTPAVLKEHRRIHTGDFLYECKICQRKFRRKNQWIIHKNGHSHGKHKCDVCGAGFTFKTHLASHLSTHKTGDGAIPTDKITRSTRSTRQNTRRNSVPDIVDGDLYIYQQRITRIGDSSPSPSQITNGSNNGDDDLTRVHIAINNNKSNSRNSAKSNDRCLSQTEGTVSEDIASTQNNHTTINSISDGAGVSQDKTNDITHSNIEPVPVTNGDIQPEGPTTCTSASADDRNQLENVADKQNSVPGVNQHVNISAVTRGSKHAKEKLFKCDECGKSFMYKSKLKRHLNVHKDRTIPKCFTCVREFKTKRGLRLHLKSHVTRSNNKCEVCHKTFATSTKLKSHMTSHTGHKPSRCDICDKAFSGYSSLKKHKMYVHGERVKRYKCDYCHKCYRDAHEKRVHERVHTGKKPFKCDVCDRNFAQRNSLRNHLLTHSDSRPKYKCDICHKSFTMPAGLKLHRRIHTGEFLHECKICQKKFTNKAHWSYHMMGHSRYQCGVCGAGFRLNKQLVSHLLSHETEDEVTTAHESAYSTQQNPLTNSVLDTVDGDLNQQRVTRIGDSSSSPSQITSNTDNVDLAQVQKCLNSNISDEILNSTTTTANSDGKCSLQQRIAAPENTGIASTQDNHANASSTNNDISVTQDKTNDVTHSTNRYVSATNGDIQPDGPATCTSASADDRTQMENMAAKQTSVSGLNQHVKISVAIQALKQADRIHNKCDICNQTFRSPVILSKHKLLHLRTGKPLKCQKCGKQFSRQKSYEAHMLNPSLHQRCLCDICGKSYATRAQLNSHMLIHAEKTVLTCDICQKTFPRPDSLRKHFHRIHTMGKRFACAVCGKRFRDSWTRKVHELIHTDLRPIVCQVCGRRFPNKYRLKLHIKTHTGEKNAECDICGVFFRDYSTVAKHKVIHTEERPYTCEKCGKTFKHRFGLRSHALTHTQERKRPHKCDVCDKRFSTRSQVTSHSHTHTGYKPYVCDVCGKRFRGKQHMMSHVANHTTPSEKTCKCDKCDKLFKHLNNLDRHIKYFHLDEYQYKCDLCSKRFQTSENMEKHKVNHVGKAHICDLCGKRFSQSSSLHLHKSVHSGTKPHKCNICGKDFRLASQLTTHNLTHTGERRHICDICGKKFTQPSSLKTHKLIHAGTKPHKCDVCGKGFALASYLTTHKRTHTGYRPYKCDICDKDFTQVSSLKTHKAIHDKKRHKCDICDKKFSQASYLKAHQLTHTGQKRHKCDICDKTFTQSSSLKTHKLRIHKV